MQHFYRDEFANFIVDDVVHKAWLNVRKRKRKLTSLKVLSEYLFGGTKENRETFKVTCHRTEGFEHPTLILSTFSFPWRDPQRPVQSSVSIRGDDSNQFVAKNMPDGFKSEN